MKHGLAIKQNKKHLNFIRSLICVVCGQINPQAAHVRIGANGGVGMKPDSRYTVPLCYQCHSKQHAIGELSFWGDINRAVDFANQLYLFSGDVNKALSLITLMRSHVYH